MSGQRQRFLVTGATGTVGGAVVAELLQSDAYEVHAVVRRPMPDHPRLVQRQLDLARAGFSAALAGTEFDAIIHAAQPRWSESTAAESFDLDVVRELERCQSARTHRLLYTSGVWLHGHQPPERNIDEHTP